MKALHVLTSCGKVGSLARNAGPSYGPRNTTAPVPIRYLRFGQVTAGGRLRHGGCRHV